MNSKKIVSSLVFAAVFSAGLVSNASAADPRWSRRRKVAGGFGLAATLYGGYRWWNRNDVQDTGEEQDTSEFMRFKGRISAHATENAPVILHHSRQGDLELCAIIGCSHETYRESRANVLFNHLLVGLRNIANGYFTFDYDQDISRALTSFVEDYVTSVPIETPIELLVINRYTGRAHFGVCHSWLADGSVAFETPSFKVEIEKDGEPRCGEYHLLDLPQVSAGNIVLCGPNILGLYRSQSLSSTDLLQKAVPGEGDTSPAENLIKFVLRHSSAQDCPGFAAIVVDLSSDGNGYGDGVIGGNGTSETGNDAHHAGQDSSGSSAVEVGHLPNEEDSGEGVGEGNGAFGNGRDVDVSWLEETNGVAGNGGGNGSSPLKVNPSWASEHPQGGAIASTAAHSGAQAVAHEVSHGADEGTAEKEHSGEGDGASANGSGAQLGEATGIDDVDESSTRTLYVAGDGGDDDAFEREDGYSDEHNKGAACSKQYCRKLWRCLRRDTGGASAKSQVEYDTFENEGM